MAILERRDNGAVAHLLLNAPDRLNALSDAMLLALKEEFRDWSRIRRHARGGSVGRRQGFLRRP